MHKKRYIPVKMKQRVAKRDGFRCQICGKQGEEQFDSAIEKVPIMAGGPIMFEFDHIVPEYLGGTNKMTNLQLACRACNRSKGYSI